MGGHTSDKNMSLAIIGGTSLLFSKLPPLREKVVSTPFGGTTVLCGEVTVLLRHQGSVPPHRINYCANLAALAIIGIDRVIAFGSSGSLKREITPGSVMIPSDFMSLSDIPSVHDHAISHVMPGISERLVKELAHEFPKALAGGVYVQTRGPRIETIAEVNALSQVADIVGMTVASEATLACELWMDFAAVCTVDNYAHGIGDEVVSWDHILETSRKFADRTGEMVESIIQNLG
jgi:5'-methylthioinosine phosphorylase